MTVYHLAIYSINKQPKSIVLSLRVRADERQESTHQNKQMQNIENKNKTDKRLNIIASST